MSRETIIIIVFATLVVLAIDMLVNRLRALEEQISALKGRAEINNDSTVKQMELLKGIIKILNHMYDDIGGIETKIDSVGRILDIINDGLGKLDDIDDYVKMMDDTVISTIRDEYKILEEIKKRFLITEAAEETNTCEEAKPD